MSEVTRILSLSNKAFRNAAEQLLPLVYDEQNYAIDGLPSSMAVGDFNNDGKLDIVTANRRNDTVSVLLVNGNGTSRPS
jgi:hypothetical protein